LLPWYNTPMEQVQQIIRETIEEKEVQFVFPSEVVSSFWRKEALSFCPTVASERFISWDTFKEQGFSSARTELPANTYSRYLFADSILQENAGPNPVFKRIVYPEHKQYTSTHLGAVVAMLPGLKDAYALLQSNPAAVEAAYREDIELLFTRYSSFLKTKGLFEPAYEPLDKGTLTGRYIIFFPQLLDDYGKYRSLLQALPQVRVIEAKGGELPQFALFENAKVELIGLMKRISAILEGGVKPWDIAVTLTHTDDWEDELLSAASLYGIPLELRGGKPLSEYPAGRLFNQIDEIAGNDFSYDAMLAFFLNPAIPFRSELMGRELLAFGREHSCFIAHQSGIGGKDAWEEKLKGGSRELLRFYLQFKKGVLAIREAKDFPSLRKAIQIFVSNYLDGKLMDEKSLKVFQFCMDTLTELTEASSRLSGLTPENPYLFFVRMLHERIYVERSESGGIPVYPYRVSAGIYPAYHFIPGASQESVRCIARPFPFLNDSQKEALMAGDTDMSEDFLRLYGRSGRSVKFSGAIEGFHRPGLVPGLFVSHNLVRKIDTGETVQWNRYSTEPWSFDGSIYPAMRDGLLRIADTEGTTRWKGAVSVTLQKENSNSSNPSGIVYISPSDLETFASCPFAYLLGRVLSIGEEEFSMSFEDSKKAGTLYHETFLRLFSYIKEKDTVYRMEHEAAYLERLASITEDVFSSYEKRGEDLLFPIWNELKSDVAEHGRLLIENESKLYNGWRVFLIEEFLSTDFHRKEGTKTASHFVLTGKVDRISEKDGMVHIIDYKKNTLPTRSEIVPDSGKPGSFQMPFYIHLAAENGYKVSAASYYQIERDTYVPVYESSGDKKAMISKENRERVMTSLLGEIQAMAEGIEQGMYPARENCDGCAFRSVCRLKYSIR